MSNENDENQHVFHQFSWETREDDVQSEDELFDQEELERAAEEERVKKEEEEKQRMLTEAVRTPFQKENEKTKAKRFSVAGLFALKINGHSIFYREAQAQGNEAKMTYHQDAMTRILDEARALGAELRLNEETGRYVVVRPVADVASLTESLKEKILDLFRAKIREKQFQANDLSNSIRVLQAEMPNPESDEFTEAMLAITNLSGSRKNLLYSVTLLQELMEEMENLIIRF